MRGHQLGENVSEKADVVFGPLSAGATRPVTISHAVALGTGGVESAPASDQPHAIPPSSHAELDVGWRPWKVVLGAFCLTVPLYGLLSSIGLFQAYWKKEMLKVVSKTDIAWIISVFGSLDCLMGAPAGILFDHYGIRWLIPLGSSVYVASFIGLAFSTTYAQFMGCMIVAGIAAAIPSTIAFSICNQWFKLKAGLATGCVTVGTALGGIFFSLVLQALFDRFTWRIAALVLAGILAGFLLLGYFLMETNLPQTTSEAGEGCQKTATLWDVAKSPSFWLIAYPIFANELVLFIQWGSIPSYAEAIGYGKNQFYLMMSYNIGAIIGRILPMWLSDRKLGPINSLIMMNLFTLAVVLAIWLPIGSRSIHGLFTVVVLMGIGTGSAVPLGASSVYTLCNSQSTGTWLGSAFSIAGIATLIGNPSVEAILERFGPDGLVAFLGVVVFTGLISVLALRWLCNGRRWVLMVKI
ncbi:putative transporter [Cladorrhinum sp. PSN332]|nr:putative transporter [Cladorrhinum sp. PSN332]